MLQHKLYEIEISDRNGIQTRTDLTSHNVPDKRRRELGYHQQANIHVHSKRQANAAMPSAILQLWIS